MTPNISKLYIVENIFSPRVWIRDLYLKIRLCLARINYQSFAILHGKERRQSRNFHCERRIPSWRGSCADHNGTKDNCQKWSLTGVWTPFPSPSVTRHRRATAAVFWMPSSWGPPFRYRLSWFSQRMSSFVCWSCLIAEGRSEERGRDTGKEREERRERLSFYARKEEDSRLGVARWRRWPWMQQVRENRREGEQGWGGGS